MSTGVLKPKHAVIWAGSFNFIALLIFHLKVAATVGKGIVDPAAIDHYVVFGALIGAIVWNLITGFCGIPSSSSHAFIGGILGATIAKAGVGPLIGSGIGKTVLFILLSPLLGMLLGAIMMVLVAGACRRQTPRRMDQWFRRLQLVSAAAYSLGHGGNDAQKTIGIICLLLITAGVMDQGESIPAWVVVSCYTVSALGTLFGG